jgi:hypothetical protein
MCTSRFYQSIDYVEKEMMQGPQGVIAVTLILIAFAVYFMLSVLVSYTDL